MTLNTDRDLFCSTLRVCGTGTNHFTSVPEQREQMGIDGTNAGFTLKSLFRGLGIDSRKKGAFSTAKKRNLFPKLGTDQSLPRGRRGRPLLIPPQSMGDLRIASAALAHQKASPLNEIRKAAILTCQLSCRVETGSKLQLIENKGSIK